ncbi:UNVERIFIED_CONTAM: hypothetical protein PYX00_002549 [Menopon gallinae]|uniref:Uncharacterized protein n=1 Tax=Menopon gallinae TaxID=328185 RepID=A0AAW2IH96_9NEOP
MTVFGFSLQEAYRRWVCSSLVPFFNGTTRVRPCRSVCQVVEQKCPYFLPENRAPSLPTQYAGEPTFLCMDPNIPETGEQLKRSLYPEKDSCCVRPCGAPRDGLCIERGSKCEEPVSYENATVEECNGTEVGASRAQNEDCPGPATHPSFKASAGSPRPLPVVLSLVVGLGANQQQLILLLLAVVFRQYLCSFGVVHLLACLCLVSAHRIRPTVEHRYNFTKVSKLIFNYFKFNSNKWQYYFILISVNLGTRSVRTQSPRHRSPASGRTSDKTRGHYYKRHSIKILSNSAQKLKLLEQRMFCGFLASNENSIFDYIVIEKITHECGISLKDNSSTINRIKVYSMMILKILLIKILHCRLNYKRRERCNAFNKQYMEMNNCSSYFNIRLLLLLLLLLLTLMNNPYIRTNVVDKSICMFLHSSRSYKFVWYYFKKYYVYENKKKYVKRRLLSVCIINATAPSCNGGSKLPITFI